MVTTRASSSRAGVIIIISFVIVFGSERVRVRIINEASYKEATTLTETRGRTDVAVRGLQLHRRMRSSLQIAVILVGLVGGVTGCGSSHKSASSPQAGKTTTTASVIHPRIEKLVVADKNQISMVARDGCLATVQTTESQIGSHDELRVRCPKPERIKAWFAGADRLLSNVEYEKAAQQKADADDDDADADDEKADSAKEPTLPAAKVLTASGKTLKVKKATDIERLNSEVKAFSAELAESEQPAAGPPSAAGWQMIHVSGPAKVLFAGTPARGVLDARLSTTGQYLCEFTTQIKGDSPLRATKSGWIAAGNASQAIDKVLEPFNETGATTGRGSFAAGVKGGAEKPTNLASTAQVFDRFAQVQDALGDACLPELDKPASSAIGL